MYIVPLRVFSSTQISQVNELASLKTFEQPHYWFKFLDTKFWKQYYGIENDQRNMELHKFEKKKKQSSYKASMQW